jgi:HTH-type transcriptional regulator / antitoxin MqsA
MNKFPICVSIMESKKITYPQEYKGKIVILEKVPAEVCRQCGEVLLKPDILKKVQELVCSETKPKRTAQVAVYDLTEVN